MENNLYIILGLPLMLIAAFVIYRTFSKKAGKTLKVVTFRGKFERVIYRFENGLECCQEQLNLEQNEEYSLLLAEAGITDAGEIDFFGLNKMLYLDKGMRRLLGLILINTDGSKLSAAQEKLIMKLKDDEVEAVLQDFFTLNPQKKAQYEILKLSAVSAMTTGARSTGGDSKKLS